MSLSWPVDGPVTQYFASNPNDIQPNGHTGVDIGVPVGTPIYAADSGNIAFEGWATKLSASNPWLIAPAYAGIIVLIDHNDGFLTLTGHMSETVVNQGQFVEKGQLVGYSGSTGLSSGPHVHIDLLAWPLKVNNGFYGRVNPSFYMSGLSVASSVSPLKTTERRTGSDVVNIRKEPNSAAEIIGQIPANTTQTFVGYAVGEMIGNYNVWYKGTDGYAWCGAFTTQTMDGLPNVTPIALKDNQRQAGPNNVNVRKEPNSNSEIIGVVPANAIQTFVGYAVGERIGDYDVWYKGTQGYVWCGGFTTQTMVGLPRVTPVVTPPVVTPPVVTPPVTTPQTYSFTKDFDFVEYIPAALNNLQIGNFPSKPEKVVIHQFGTLGVDTLTSTINTFSNPNSGRIGSAHFVVSGKRIIQMVSLKDRAYHAKEVGNNYVGIETDPAQDADTIASTKKLLAALKAKYGYELPKILHKNVEGNSTNCGDSITLSNYNLDPVVTPTPDPVPVGKSEEEVITEFLTWYGENLKQAFLHRKN